MWYWVCEGDPDHNRIAFSVKACVRLWIHAHMLKMILKRPGVDVWIRKDPEHSDPDYKQYGCPDCGNKMSKRELDATWDWAGPHCNACGCTGMSMFAAVTALKPIMSGYQGIRAGYAKIIGWKKIEEIERKERAKRKN